MPKWRSSTVSTGFCSMRCSRSRRNGIRRCCRASRCSATWTSPNGACRRTAASVKYKGRYIDLRVSIMPASHGEDAVLRVLDKETLSEKFQSLSLDVVGFAAEEMKKFRRYIREPYGMVLVTGPTGSGKTTTLYAAINEIKTDEDKIVTIED